MTQILSMEQAARAAVARLQQQGYTAYWAGGCVRDRLLQRPPKDFDLATNAHPDNVLRLFPGANEVGRAFGVILCPVHGYSMEVATFRRDSTYEDGRRPRSIEFCSPREDAQRRDFTINAMFYDPIADRLHDFTGGRQDLEQRLIRCVGDANTRLQEDHLRMLRAVRFAHTLDFRLDPDVAAAIRRHATSITRISAERIRDELLRILLEAQHPGDAVRTLSNLGLLQHVLPEVEATRGQEQPPQFHPEGDVFEHTCLMLNQMETRDPVLALAVLLHDIGKPPTARQAEDRLRFNGHASEGARMAEHRLRALRVGNRTLEAVRHCIYNHMRFVDVHRMRKATLRRMVGSEYFPQELELHRLDCLASHGKLDHHAFLQEFMQQQQQEPILPDPWLRGTDLLAMGLTEGPEIGTWLRKAYDAQLEQQVATPEDLHHWIQKEIDAQHDSPQKESRQQPRPPVSPDGDTKDTPTS